MKVLVTGATSGIGAALVLCLRKKGCEVFGTGRKPLEGGLSADLATRAGRQKVVAWMKEVRPDIVINCAGLGYYGPVTAHPVEDELEIIEVNVIALAHLTIEALKVLPKGGTIMNISSAAAYMPMPDHAVYAASKAFVNSFSEGVDGEEHGVRVLTFCPGMVDTDFGARASKSARKSTSERMGVEEVAEAIWRQIQTGKRVQVYNWKYRLGVWIAQHMPRSWLFKRVRSNISKRYDH